MTLRSSMAMAAASLVVLACAPDATPAPDDITQGVWIGDGGPDLFLFDLQGNPPDSLSGFVHVMRDGKMDSELAITRASYHPPDLEMYIEATNATYTGRVDTSRGRIEGALGFGGEAGPDMELRWADPTGMPGFAALEGDGPYAYRQPVTEPDGWPVAAPEEVGMDATALEGLVQAVAAREAGVLHSLLVVRHGKLVLDEYFHGYTQADLHRLASTTKSVSSLLVGAAWARGFLAGLDMPVLSFFPQVPPPQDPAWQDETLEHLLTMSMGLDWTAQEAQSVHGTGEDFFTQLFSRHVANPPGTRWDYVSANVNLLAGVIHNATGQHAESFAQEALFSPLGITTYDWSYGREDGYNLMDGSLQLRPRDLARIGVMVAQGGLWEGQQIIPEAWVSASTQQRFATGEPLAGYGYLWWLSELPTGHGLEPVVVANGWGSQFIVIFPALDLVLVTTGGNDDNGRHLDLAGVLVRTLLAAM